MNGAADFRYSKPIAAVNPILTIFGPYPLNYGHQQRNNTDPRY